MNIVNKSDLINLFTAKFSQKMLFLSVKSIFLLQWHWIVLMLFFAKKIDFPKIRYKNLQYLNLVHMHKPKFWLGVNISLCLSIHDTHFLKDLTASEVETVFSSWVSSSSSSLLFFLEDCPSVLSKIYQTTLAKLRANTIFSWQIGSFFSFL